MCPKKFFGPYELTFGPPCIYCKGLHKRKRKKVCKSQEFIFSCSCGHHDYYLSLFIKTFNPIDSFVNCDK